MAVKMAPMASWQDHPGRKPEVCGDSVASHSGSKAWRTTVCRARSVWVGMPKGRLSVREPRLGIQRRLSAVAVPSRGSSLARRHRWGGVRVLAPSIPAVCFPRLSWGIRRTAHSRADHDFTSNFCSLCTVLTSSRCAARSIRFWRRKTWRCPFFHALPCQATFRDTPCVVAPCL
jgi:hypothetical protein